MKLADTTANILAISLVSSIIQARLWLEIHNFEGYASMFETMF